MFEDVATDVTERIVAEFVALAPLAEHSWDDVASLCTRHTSALCGFQNKCTIKLIYMRTNELCN